MTIDERVVSTACGIRPACHLATRVNAVTDAAGTTERAEIAHHMLSGVSNEGMLYWSRPGNIRVACHLTARVEPYPTAGPINVIACVLALVMKAPSAVPVT